jgi:hypothetical protein
MCAPYQHSDFDCYVFYTGLASGSNCVSHCPTGSDVHPESRGDTANARSDRACRDARADPHADEDGRGAAAYPHAQPAAERHTSAPHHGAHARPAARAETTPTPGQGPSATPSPDNDDHAMPDPTEPPEDEDRSKR